MFKIRRLSHSILIFYVFSFYFHQFSVGLLLLVSLHRIRATKKIAVVFIVSSDGADRVRGRSEKQITLKICQNDKITVFIGRFEFVTVHILSEPL